MTIQPSEPSSSMALLNRTAPTLNPPNDPTSKGGNVDALIAEMLGEDAKLNKEAQPTAKQQAIAYIEKALSDALNSNDFMANMTFWKGLQGSLPKGSPLEKFATSQLNLFAHNPELEKLQSEFASDNTNLQNALEKVEAVTNAANTVQSKIDSVQEQISSIEKQMSTDPWYDKIKDAFEIAGLGCELGGLYIALGAVKYIGEPAAKLIYNTGGLQTTVNQDEGSIAREENVINSQSRNLNIKGGVTASGVLNLASQANETTRTELSQETSIAKAILASAHFSKA